MPYSRPGYMAYVTRLSGDHALNHGEPVAKDNFVGVAVKQKANPWTAGFTGLRAIGDNEDYAIITKGIVMVPDTGISTPAKGDAVYITSANALTKTASANTAFGRIVELPADGRGVPAGHVRIDLDKKDSI